MIQLLTTEKPAFRAQMVDLLGHKWMRGKFTTKDEFVQKWGKVMKRTVEAQANNAKAFDVDFCTVKGVRMRGMRTGDTAIDIDKAWAKAKGREFRPFEPLNKSRECTVFSVIGDSLEIMDHLVNLFNWYDGNKDED